MTLTLDEQRIERNFVEDGREIILMSEYERCQICHYGKLIKRPREKDKDSLVIYTRNGTVKGYHQEKRCNNQSLPCRAGHFYGYITTSKNEKVIDEYILRNDFIITSRQTAFSVDYLWDISLQILFSQASFESLANIYNNLFFTNCSLDVMNRREEMVRKRISEAWFYYAYIDLGQRWKMDLKLEDDLESSIRANMTAFKDRFRSYWTEKHACDLKGCKSVLVLDGGMKPHRSVCGDTLSGVTEFKSTGNKVVTGRCLMFSKSIIDVKPLLHL